MIRAILFDLGGTILEKKPVNDNFADITNLMENTERIEESNFQNDFSFLRNETQMDSQDSLQGVIKQRTQENLLKSLSMDDFENISPVREGFVDLLNSLKKKYKLGVVSHTLDPKIPIDKTKGLFKFFDLVLFSHEVNLRKDNEKIFLLAAKKLNVKPKECIFIDDIEKFVKVSKKANFNGIRFESLEQLTDDLGKLRVDF